MLGHEPSLNTFYETGITPTAFSDNNKIFKLDSKTKWLLKVSFALEFKILLLFSNESKKK